MMRRPTWHRTALFAMACSIAGAAPAFAEWHLKPYAGFVFGGSTTLPDIDRGTEERHLAVGGTVTLIGNVLGVEADFLWAPRFFEANVVKPAVARSNMTALTGNVVVAMPRRMTGYGLRPYGAAGIGMIHASMEDLVEFASFSETRAALNVGGGVTGFLTDRFGLSWDVRYFRTLGTGETLVGLETGQPQISFWRANMSLVVRY